MSTQKNDTHNDLIIKAKQGIISPEEWANKQMEELKDAQNLAEKEYIITTQTNISVNNITNRPSVDTVNPDDEAEIVNYTARQNLACAFSCCAKTESPARVQELAKIFNNNLGENEFVHLTLWERKGDEKFPQEWAATKQNDPNYASQYFLVHIQNEPQNEEEKQKFLAEFKEIYTTFVNKND